MRTHGAIRGPALVGVAIGNQELAVFCSPQFQKPVELAAWDVEIAHVAGEQRGVHGGDGQRLDDGHKAVRPAPAIIATPPFAAHRLADDAVGADVVRAKTAVGRNAFGPGLQIVRDPAAITVVASVHKGVGDEAGRREIEGHVAAHLALIERVQNLGVDLVLVPVRLPHVLARIPGLHLGGNVQVVERDRVFGQDPTVGGPVFPRIDEARPLAPGDGRADHAFFGIPVGRGRVVAGVKTGEAQRTRAVRFPIRVGKTEIVEVDRGLAVMHPVVVGVELTVDLAVGGELAGDGFPEQTAAAMEVGVTTQRIE